MAIRYQNIEISLRDSNVEFFDSIIGITWINLHVQYYCQTIHFLLIRPYFLPGSSMLDICYETTMEIQHWRGKLEYY